MEHEALAAELTERKTYVRWFLDVLNYQLFEVDGHPFTLSKITMGVFLLILSYLLARRASAQSNNACSAICRLRTLFATPWEGFPFIFFSSLQRCFRCI